MKKYQWIIILANLVVLLIFFGNSIFTKEKILTNGKLVLLELAPADPRSLMQGDYMRLRYKIAELNDPTQQAKRGYCVVRLDSAGVAGSVRLQAGTKPLHEGEYLIEYTAADGRINIGAESFFFEEGQAKKFEDAKYGGLRIDNHGNSVLVGLYNSNRKHIE